MMILAPRPKQIAEVLDQTGGRFFSVLFQKKDGTLRSMVARIGSQRVKGTGMSYNPRKRALMPVWDVSKGAWRMVNLRTVRQIRAGGQEYRVKWGSGWGI